VRGVTIEIKARCPDLVRVRRVLKTLKARFKGLDHQIDTYFRVPSGRLKLREGNIENALIYYKRQNQKRSKVCNASLYRCRNSTALKKILSVIAGVLAVVDKKREIYFLKNVKFHIDRVKKLGNFVEIEAFGRAQAAKKLKEQCEFYQGLFGIKPRNLVADSYSDQILKRSH